VLEGQINSVLHFLGETSTRGILELLDDVKTQLKEKQPNPQPTILGSLLFGLIDDDTPESLYLEISGELVKQAALWNKVSAADDTDTVLLIYASIAFSALNRATTLHNRRFLYPVIAMYAINTYRMSARLF